MSVAKELKMNNRIVVREACRVAANHFRHPSNHYKNDFTDSSMVIKNHPDDIGPFIRQMALSLDINALKHVGIQEIMNRLPPLSPTFNYLCVYDFYKALRDSKYFSVERALKRISQFGERKEGMKFTRKNARGHYTSACSPTMKAYTQSFCSEFNYNWRMILTLGSRLCVGSSRELEFKTGPEPLPYLDAKMIPGYDNKFTVTIVNHAPEEKTFAQLRAFMNATNPELFHYTFRRFGSSVVFTVTVRAPQVKAPDFDEPKEVIKGNLTVDTSKANFLKIYKPESVPVEEHFYKEMEKSVNEMTIVVDDYDRQIDELTGKADKIRAQRAKLLHAMQELRK
ncbi:hypothetical protein CPT_CIP9_194 [Enterobacter phage vB_EclM_CIP9]|uniref:Uncharacterized protein n=1 Tax=Enterobacter phage vB_EclM_CIP9 TaxID=2696340 RepID=A0A6B9XZK5_9CAUD|nr:hypothetical protein HWD05_gp194 [Enterobacter phage vB_EclM_CIP9]QHS01730.1 hypothetical protein CPT_CIP9_194 [Enterobacter phage vB_EclM_CIP9]